MYVDESRARSHEQLEYLPKADLKWSSSILEDLRVVANANDIHAAAIHGEENTQMTWQRNQR